MHIQGGFNKGPSRCLVGGADGTLVFRLGPRFDLGSASEGAGMQRGRQAKHTAVSRRVARPNSERVVWGHTHFTG